MEIVVNSIKDVVKDDGFLLPTPQAKEALTLATAILEWTSNSHEKQMLKNFCVSLCESFSNQIISTRVNNKIESRKLWAHFHKVITCTQFKTSWTTFLQLSIGAEYCPMFCQYVTRAVHEKLISLHLPATESQPSIIKELTTLELNALNYAAGYVIKRVKQKIGEHPNSDQLLDAVEEFSCPDDDDLDTDESEKWINLVDRGGLTHINHKTFNFFRTVEIELRQHYNTSKIGDTSKKTIVNAIKEDVDVKYRWSEICEDVCGKIQEVLLDEVVTLYVIIRGFSYSKSWLEMYKKDSKTSLQKSKALRKKVSSDS